ncbi:MAG: cupredoxin domain-containing protein [Chloroflexi bacterium]|nr:cupredoxin domain-containing protein [Chloroflexota bacterium]
MTRSTGTSVIGRESTKSSMGSRSMVLLVVMVLLATACRAAATPAPSWPSDAIVVTARNLRFDTTQLLFKADTPSTLVLVNEDGDAHNIAIRTRSGFEGDLLFRFDPVAATTIAVPVGPLPKGTYFFLCEIHPSMSGTVFVY